MNGGASMLASPQPMAMDAALERLVREQIISAHEGLEKALDKEAFAKNPLIASQLGEHAVA